MNNYQQLEQLMQQLSHLNHLQAIANWDEAVMMPTGGGQARAKALATLQGLKHDLLSQKENGDLIKAAHDEKNLDDWQHANLKWIQKKYINATCLPNELVRELTQTSIECEQAWRTLRSDNNWKAFAPLLEKTFKLVKQSAEIRSEKLELNPYDVLIDEYSPNMSQSIIDPLFLKLKETLPPIIEKIITQQTSPIIPNGPFAIETQKQLGLDVMRTIGFDFDHGRLDTSHHPFCGGVPEDTRITTRYNNDEFISALMGIIHETGHARYEQQLPQTWREQPVGNALGMAVHESQSLLMEMQAGRSQSFMHFLSKKIREQYGDDPAYTPENLFTLYTRVERGFIRVDADEVTYPLHVILRYELERDLFNNALSISELPDAWDAKMNDYLGLSTKNNFKDGVMQDVHWPAGIFGYFPAYTLGSLMAAQWFAAAKRAHPEIDDQLAAGDFTALNEWLRIHVHERASSVSTQKLLVDATGEDLNPQFFIDHIHERYLKN